jgi:hypothetical protein
MTPEEKAKNREQLKAKLRDKIFNKSIGRKSKKNRNEVMEKGMEKMGIDKQKFMEALEAVKKVDGKISMKL